MSQLHRSGAEPSLVAECKKASLLRRWYKGPFWKALEAAWEAACAFLGFKMRYKTNVFRALIFRSF